MMLSRLSRVVRLGKAKRDLGGLARRRREKTLRVESLETRALMAVDTLGAILGTVRDGSSGAGLGGAAVELYVDTDNSGGLTAQDALVSSTTSSSASGSLGQYRFNNLAAGRYFVKQTAVAGYAAPTAATVNISASQAAGVLGTSIDSFDVTPQVVSASQFNTTSFSAVPASEAIGDERELLVTYSGGVGSIGQSVSTSSGFLQFGAFAGTTGSRSVIWDGADNSSTLDRDGLGGVDLTANPNNGAEPNTGLQVSYRGDIAGGTMTLIVYSGPNGATESRVSRSIPVSNTAVKDVISFSEFAGADFTDVGAIVMEVSGSSDVDAEVSDITAISPTLLRQDLTNTPQVDLSITKTDGLTQIAPGQSLTYTVVVTNNGPAPVTGARIVDNFPAALTNISYTSTTSGAASGNTAAGNGSISDTVNLGVGASIAYTINATVSAAATGSLTNTATVTAPTGANETNLNNNTATDTDTLVPTVDLSITKTDGVTQVTPGQSLTYTIVVRNSGPSNVSGAQVADAFPTALVGVSYTSSASGGATGNSAAGAGSIADTVNLPAGSSITYTVQATVSPNATGSLTNTATVSAPSGVTETNLSNNSATDVDTLTPRVDLAITKTDGLTTVTPGQNLTYTIVVSNSGPSAAVGATVVDNFPATLTNVSYTSTASSGASGNTASGSGALSETVNLAPGASITYTVQATVAASASGSLTNTATVAAATGTIETNLANNTATDTDTLIPTVDLAITKTDGVTQVVPGQALTYTIVVSNSGPSHATGARVVDNFPATLTNISYTSTASSGASGNTASGSGALNETVNLAPGASITYTVQATVAATAIGSLTNTATVTAAAGTLETNLANNSATDTDTLNPTVDLAITKTDGVTQVVPGQNLTYTIVVTNNGPSFANAARVVDNFPATLTNITFTSSATSGASGNTSGAGVLNQTVNLAPGSSITYTVQAKVAPSAIGSLTNTATVTAAPGVTDSNPSNNTASDTDTLTPRVDLAITKTDGVTQVTPGQSLTYTIVVTNNGPSNVTGARVTDTFPATLTNITYMSSAGPGASGNTASGSGNINDTVNLASGASIAYTVQARVAASATGTLTNTATVAAPNGVTETNAANNSATDTDTLRPTVDLSITKTDGLTTVVPGQNLTYTIVVRNSGPSNAIGASVVDAMPAFLTNVTYTSTAASGASGNTTSGSGSINDTVSIASGSSITYTVRGTVAANATGSLTNTATVAAPTGVTETNTANNSATDTDTLRPTADLSVTKTDGVTSVTRGQTITYTIVVRNTGPSDVLGARVSDLMPTALTNATYTTTTTGGARSANPTGSGSISDRVNLPSGSSITYRVRATVAQTAPTGVIVNTVTVTPPSGVTDPTPTNNTATDTDTLPPPLIQQNIASVAGHVYLDINNNGVRDAGDLGIGGVTITLRRAGAADQTRITAADGSYAFTNLVAGTYSLIETQPAGFETSNDTIGNAGGTNPVDNVFEQIALTGTQVALGYNFGETLSKRRYIGG